MTPTHPAIPPQSDVPARTLGQCAARKVSATPEPGDPSGPTQNAPDPEAVSRTPINPPRRKEIDP